MRKINCRIKGIVPLLMHRFPAEDEGVEEKSKKRTGVPAYELEVEKSLYRLPDGTIYQPATHIEGALMKAATNFQIPGKRKKTYKDLVKSAVFIYPDAIPHKIPKYEIDKRAVVNPSTRGRVMRYRPIFKNWELEFQIEVRDDQMPVEVLKQILDYAGTNIGIGDFRPRYGRFIVTKFEEA